MYRYGNTEQSTPRHINIKIAKFKKNLKGNKRKTKSYI